MVARANELAKAGNTEEADRLYAEAGKLLVRK